MKTSEENLPLVPVEPKEYYTLSSAQLRVWMEWKLRPSILFYNIFHVYEISGDLKVEYLQQSLQIILDRHEVLRSQFMEVDGRPVQVVRPQASVSMPLIDLSEYDRAAREEFERRFLNQEINYSFNLREDLPVRTSLVRLGPHEHLFVLVVHHIVCDHWSMDIFYKELSHLYNGLSAGHPVFLPPLPIQYRDYAEWEQNPNNAQRTKDHSYWKDELSGSVPILDLPYDRPRPPDASYNGNIQRTRLDSHTLSQLKELSKSMNVTLFMLLFSAFNVFLHKLTGEVDLVVGTFLANRQRKELLNLIGILFNNLPIRSDLGGNPSFREVVVRVRDRLFEAFSHINYSYDELLKDLLGTRTSNRPVLYNTSFQLYYKREHELVLPGLRIRQRRIVKDTLYDLMGYAQEIPDGLQLWFNYNTDLFEDDTVRRFLAYFRSLLLQILANPDLPLSDLELMTSEEKGQLLNDFNNSTQPYPRLKTLIELFVEQVAQVPDRIALTTGSEHAASRAMSYRELDARANQLAHFLLRQGIQPGDVVGILLGRTIETVIAYLAILKAGGVCLSMEVNYPRERLRYMTRDCGARAVITSEAIYGRNYLRKSTLRIDIHDEQIWCEDAGHVLIERAPEDLAAIIYTSGSTGRPKGVQLCHRGLVNQVFHRMRILSLSSKDVLCLSLSLGFVTFPLQLFSALITGAQLILYSAAVIKDPITLFRSAERDEVNAIEITVSTLSAYLQYLEEHPTDRVSLHALRVLMVAGEKLKPQVARQFFHQYPSMTLMNAYGQTECSGMTLSSVVPADSEITRVFEGRPSSNNQVYLLDTNRRLVPLGVIGEIYVSGDGLAQGYLKKPQKTAEVFQSHPFIPGQKIYRTGDLGRMACNGAIEVLGRIDDQVKVRGYRIEPGEIEAVLQQYPDIRACLVTPRSLDGAEAFLVAYYLSSVPIDVKALRSHLKKFVPDYMIPSYLVRLEQFPLNPNGKIDKKALPLPSGETQHMSRPDEPRTELEKTLVHIWEEVLNIHGIGLHDDFFDIGGHSLQAIQVVSRLHTVFGREFEPTTVFDHPTISRLAHMLSLSMQ